MLSFYQFHKVAINVTCYNDRLLDFVSEGFLFIGRIKFHRQRYEYLIP